MNRISFLLLILITAAPSASAAPCPDLNGIFEAKVGPLINRLEIKQNACDSFELILANSAEVVLKRVYHTDSIERTLFHSGRKVELSKAQMERIQVGNQELVSLRIDTTEIDRYLDTTVKEKINFYVEGSGDFRNLVERKDIYDAEGNRLGRIYIGYAKANQP